MGADALSRLGYAVTIMDSAQAPGGRLVNGLAGFKVDRAVIERRVQSLKERGVQFRMGVLCGRDVTLSELRRDYDAVLFALGRTEAVPLDIPGAQLRGVCQAYPFILHHTSDAPLRAPPVNVEGRQVVVLGGGDTAMDALRIALRAGARDALCVYRRDREQHAGRSKRNGKRAGRGRALPVPQPACGHRRQPGRRSRGRALRADATWRARRLRPEPARSRCRSASLKFRRMWCWWLMASPRRACRIATNWPN